MNVSFSKSEFWSDRLGNHAVVEIRRGPEIIGSIRGDSGTAIPMMEYTVEITGAKKFTALTLQDAKARVRDLFRRDEFAEYLKDMETLSIIRRGKPAP
jgi:hypothetical protein